MPDSRAIVDIDIGDAFKDLVWGALVKAALSALFAAVPFLGSWFLAPIVSLVVSWFADYLYDVGKEFIDFQKIIFKNVELERKYRTKSLELKFIARDHGIDSPAFAAARKESQRALSDFVRIGAR